MGLLYLAAAVAYLVTAALYFRGAFPAASATGLAFAILIGRTLAAAASPPLAAVLILLLVAAPGALVCLHAVDARQGLFLWPTIYMIPLAFATGVLALVAAAIALLV